MHSHYYKIGSKLGCFGYRTKICSYTKRHKLPEVCGGVAEGPLGGDELPLGLEAVDESRVDVVAVRVALKSMKIMHLSVYLSFYILSL